MAATLPTLLAILAGTCTLFAVVMVAALRQRRKQMARRTCAIRIDLGGDSFEADVLPTMRQRVILHPAGNTSTVLLPVRLFVLAMQA